MDEVAEFRGRYLRIMEEGRMVEVFTSMPEWQWYVDTVVQPTIDDYVKRILEGSIKTDKEDWILRGMIMGMKLVVETTGSFKARADAAKDQSKKMEEHIKNEA